MWRSYGVHERLIRRTRAPGRKGLRLVVSCAALTGMPVRRHIGAMDARYENRQRIDRLTPLATALRRIEECVLPVAPCRAPLDNLLGATLAADIVVPQPHPAAPVALIDGFAVRAEWTADAGSYRRRCCRMPPISAPATACRPNAMP